ncbi:glyoxalase/bleomycin resistance/extradiol dioxygenase family protein [Roseateles aquatilis]|uniref:Bleomycin resistance protein n=1 Tax=Roseateles aquatilis TaxID=431061 RepID=A0A246J104_9BURK|nr:glyoxalase superfamily protein [Roseateles aquatilis]OWQ86281.1 glyoxalase/bleomycin resistance/extradiol dioxygenase family protein [Roseateles aquatilis]
MTFTVQQSIPILRIFDIAKAREFYLDYLGFEVDWEHRFDDTAPLYMQISRGDWVLHLSEHHGDSTPGSVVLVQVQDVEALHAELSAKHYRYLRPGIEHMPWNAKMLQLIDPFGNRLRLNESLD